MKFKLDISNRHRHIVLRNALQECMDKKGPAIESVSGKQRWAQKYAGIIIQAKMLIIFFVVCVFQHIRWKLKSG